MTAPPSSSARSKLPVRIHPWWALWLGVSILGLWLRWPVPWLLPAVPLLVLAALPRRGSSLPYPVALAAVLLVAATSGALLAHDQLHRLRTDWDTVWSGRESRAADVLTDELDALMDAGEGAVADLAASPPAARDSLAEQRLRELRRSRGLAAMAVYGPDGTLRLWDGVHRGAVPREVRTGDAPYGYGESPLFSYLYVTRRIPSTGGTAMAAALLRVSLPPGLSGGTEDFASRIRERTGERIRISRAERVSGESVWDLRWAGRTLFSVSVVKPRQSDEREELLVRWGRIVLLLTGMAWLLLTLGGGGLPGRYPAAAATLLAGALVLPLGRILCLPELDSPTSFLLAPPLDATLLRTLAVTVAGTLVLGMTAAAWKVRGRRILGLATVGLAFPVGVWLFQSAPSADFLARSEGGFVVVELALALGLAGAAAVGLLLASAPGREGAEPRALVLGSGGSVLLALGSAAWVAYRGSLPAPVAALWILPTAAMLGSGGFRRGPLTWLSLWGGAALLGITCALPFAWQARIGARMEVGESELTRLGTPVDPYTEFLLQRFAERVDSLEGSGAGPVELLYEGWVESGMAEEGMPAWLTLWSAGDLPREDLRLGLPPPRPPAADEFLAAARSSGSPVIRRLERRDAHYVAAVPLASGAVVTAVIPPRTWTRSASPLEPLFAGERPEAEEPLTLVPLLPGDVPSAPDTTVWKRTSAGWRGERTLELPDGRFHAHYSVFTPRPALLVARGTLLFVLDLAVASGLFLLGVVVKSGRSLPLERLAVVTRTFRGRVTLALFAFFLLSVGVFGVLGYRVLSGAAVRTSTTLADRVADEAAGWYLDVQGSMDLLARRVGSDLVRYRRGELVGGSVTELVELGLYEGWVPWTIHRTLAEREAVMERASSSVGRWRYVVAYRRLPDGSVLGAPVPLQAGAAALRRRELIDFLGFAVLLGATLSLGLAFLVGRTLARPIQELRGAAGRVGRGDLSVRLTPERSDEFGVVFRDFNRMVGRLRRARRELVRTTRRTRAIMEEAATGMVALDGEGRVTLVNPRAEELLGARIQPGGPLPDAPAPSAELAGWAAGFLSRADAAAGTELRAGERRIRVQARRIAGGRRRTGAVVSLEDVTDELRAERILAWGEMARQVAHEVKNPLTPIKLSVQHVRRAFEDRRADFPEILERNVEAMLREIDRLDAIARSFSRFAAPGAAGGTPLEEVRVEEVVTETLVLYATEEGDVRFEADLDPELPPVRGRAAELQEVLVNLLENARTAVDGGGEVRVEAEERDGGVELRVMDDGQGIPEELLPRIFEPRFSTRSSGAGLGLAIVRRLVESWGGHVSVESRPGRGTTVRVRLRRWGDGPGSERPSGEGKGSGGPAAPSSV